MIAKRQLHAIELRAAQLSKGRRNRPVDPEVVALCEDVAQLLYELDDLYTRFGEAVRLLGGGGHQAHVDAILERERISRGGR